MIATASAPSFQVWSPEVSPKPETRTCTDTADIRSITEEIELPSDQKVTWIIETLAENDRAIMGVELLRATVRACRTGDLFQLVERILSWEATAEEIADGQNPEAIRDTGEPETPMGLDELKRYMGT